MKLHLRTFRWTPLPQRIRGMFNLNDPRWGRGDDKSPSGEKSEPNSPDGNAPLTPPKADNERGQKMGANQGPPDFST
jgi:membrane protease subunit HflK